MTAPTGNALLTLTLITNLGSSGSAFLASGQAHKEALEFAVSEGQLPAQGAPLETARAQAALDAYNALVASPAMIAFQAAQADIADSVSILNEAANQS